MFLLIGFFFCVFFFQAQAVDLDGFVADHGIKLQVIRDKTPFEGKNEHEWRKPLLTPKQAREKEEPPYEYFRLQEFLKASSPLDSQPYRIGVYKMTRKVHHNLGFKFYEDYKYMIEPIFVDLTDEGQKWIFKFKVYRAEGDEDLELCHETKKFILDYPDPVSTSWLETVKGKLFSEIVNVDPVNTDPTGEMFRNCGLRFKAYSLPRHWLKDITKLFSKGHFADYIELESIDFSRKEVKKFVEKMLLDLTDKAKEELKEDARDTSKPKDERKADQDWEYSASKSSNGITLSATLSQEVVKPIKRENYPNIQFSTFEDGKNKFKLAYIDTCYKIPSGMEPSDFFSFGFAKTGSRRLEITVNYEQDSPANCGPAVHYLEATISGAEEGQYKVDVYRKKPNKERVKLDTVPLTSESVEKEEKTFTLRFVFGNANFGWVKDSIVSTWAGRNLSNVSGEEAMDLVYGEYFSDFFELIDVSNGSVVNCRASNAFKESGEPWMIVCKEAKYEHDYKLVFTCKGNCKGYNKSVLEIPCSVDSGGKLGFD